MLTSVKDENKPLAEKAADQIARLIADRELKRGEKLPNEFELCQQLQVGRGTIREAIKILVSRNIVEIHRGKGTFVCHHPGQMDDPLGLSFVGDKMKLAADLTELRLILEPEIAALAAERAEKEDMERLKEAARRVEDLCLRGLDHTEADVGFHEELARCSHNRVIPRLMPTIRLAVSVFVKFTNAALYKETVRSHNAIVDAVSRHDKEGAREAMREHLEGNWKYMSKNIQL